MSGANTWVHNDLCGDPQLSRFPRAHWLLRVMDISDWVWVIVRMPVWGAHCLWPPHPVDGDGESTRTELEELKAVVRLPPLAIERINANRDRTSGTIEIPLLLKLEHMGLLDAVTSPPDSMIEVIDASFASPRTTKEIIPAARTKTMRSLPGAPKVIVAIIDDGIAIANGRFRDASGDPRVQAFYNMNDPARTGTKAVRKADPCDYFGASWTYDELEDLFKEFEDEEDIYAAMGMFGPSAEKRHPLRWRSTHGTAVLDLLAGADPAAAGDEAHPIIAVQLPSAHVEDRSGTLIPVSIHHALGFIEQSALGITASGRHLPLIVCLSYGVQAGPHDGRGAIAHHIDTFVQNYRQLTGCTAEAAVVVSAGNSLQTRQLAVTKAGPAGCTKTLRWRVLPDDRTSSYVEIWLPETAGDAGQQVKARLTPPRHAPENAIDTILGGAIDWCVDGKVLARIYHQSVERDGNRKRERITIAIRPTAAHDVEEPTAPFGEWCVSLENVCLAAGECIEWRIVRDDPEFRVRRRGRQSRWEHESYGRYAYPSGRIINDERSDDGPIRRQRTLSDYGTAEHAVVAAGYRRSDGEPATYSASGPTRSGRMGPDVALPSEDSPAFTGVLASGTRTNSVSVISGTSAAAPQLARELAEQLRNGQSLDDLLADVEAAEAAGIDGPHRRYSPQRELRHGAGRLVIPPPAAHRRRITEHPARCRLPPAHSEAECSDGND